MTRELGSRWVPHPVSGTASTENEPLAPRRPVAAARASFPLKLFEAVSPPGRPPAPPAAPGSGKRGRRRAGPRCRPLPSWPLPSPTPTAPAPHPRDPPGAARPPPGYTTRRGAGGGAAGADRPQCGRPGRGRRGSRAVGPGVPCGLPHPSPPSAPLPAGVGDRNRLPTWRTGSGPARRREHSSLAGSEESGPGAPASGGASRTDSRARRPTGAFRGENDPRDEGVPTAPQTANPKATGGLGVAGEGGRFLASAQPGSVPPAGGSRDTARARIH